MLIVSYFFSTERLQVYRILYLQCRHHLCIWGTSGPYVTKGANHAELCFIDESSAVLYNNVPLYSLYSKGIILQYNPFTAT